MPRLDRRAAYAEQPRAVQAIGRGHNANDATVKLGATGGPRKSSEDDGRSSGVPGVRRLRGIAAFVNDCPVAVKRASRVNVRDAPPGDFGHHTYADGSLIAIVTLVEGKGTPKNSSLRRSPRCGVREEG